VGSEPAAPDASWASLEERYPFDLQRIDRIEVLPLGHGQAAPDARRSAFNGHVQDRDVFTVEGSLVWESARSWIASHPHQSPAESFVATFTRYGKFVSGDHMSASVIVVAPGCIERAIQVVSSMVPSGETIDAPGRPPYAVKEWSPARVTIDGGEVEGFHVVCADQASEVALLSQLEPVVDVWAWVAFSRSGGEDVVVESGGRQVRGWWDPLSVWRSPGIRAWGTAGPGRTRP
jgi:hypothetical protein